MLRPLDEPATLDGSPWLYPGQTHWFDSFGLDSVFDYDPVWAACRELGFVAAFHGGLTVRPGLHWSITSYVANHVGQFAAEMYPLCKSLLFGGVTARFPDLPFAFLECGVSWAMQMLCDTIEHWEKRNVDALPRMDPATLDRDELGAVLREIRRPHHRADRHRPVRVRAAAARSTAARPTSATSSSTSGYARPPTSSTASPGRSTSAARRTTAASRPRSRRANPGGARLRAMFSSDIGHWDVPDMAGVVAESFELVEDGVVTPEQWRAVVCDNPVEMYRRANPNFFAGTAVEGYTS